jgi:hypothetical protein
VDKQEVARLMAIKAALTVTTNSIGWQHIKQMADNAVTQAMQDAMDADTREKGEDLRLEARALQRGFKKLFDAIETVKAFAVGTTEDSGLGELETL